MGVNFRLLYDSRGALYISRGGFRISAKRGPGGYFFRNKTFSGIRKIRKWITTHEKRYKTQEKETKLKKKGTN